VQREGGIAGDAAGKSGRKEGIINDGRIYPSQGVDNQSSACRGAYGIAHHGLDWRRDCSSCELCIDLTACVSVSAISQHITKETVVHFSKEFRQQYPQDHCVASYA